MRCNFDPDQVEVLAGTKNAEHFSKVSKNLLIDQNGMLKTTDFPCRIKHIDNQFIYTKASFYEKFEATLFKIVRTKDKGYKVQISF